MRVSAEPDAPPASPPDSLENDHPTSPRNWAIAVREPLILPFCALAFGILLGRALEFSTAESALETLGFTALAATLAFVPADVSPALKRLTTALALIFAGAFLYTWHLPERVPFIETAPREVVLVEGCVVEPNLFSANRSQFTLELAPGARARVQLPAFSPDYVPPQLNYGQRVAVEARVREPRNFRNPGAFDYASYLARRNTYWTAQVPTNGAVRLLAGECGSTVAAWVYQIRGAALLRIDALFPDDSYASAMLQAILIGESAGLERVWTDDFRRSGTYHALVISGLHVSVLAAVLLFLLRFASISPSTAVAITALAAWGYALISGFSTPVVRAATGLTLYLGARLIFRRTRILNLLAAIAILFLILDPAQLFEASFQLSFLAVAAIGAFAAPLLEATTGPYARGAQSISNVEVDPHVEPRVAQFRVELRLAAETLALWSRLPKTWASRSLAFLARLSLFSVEVALISASIQIGLALPMAVYFHRVSFTGLSANLLIVPLMNLIVPSGFLSLASGWHWTASLTSHLLGLSRGVAAFHAGIEPAWRIPNPPAWLALAFIAALIVAAITIRRQRHRSLAILTTLGLLGLILANPWPAETSPGTLELTAIDVGQGDSLLVVFPEGATMLIDGGGRPDYSRTAAPQPRTGLDMGEDVVAPYLWSRNIHHLDILAATHAHQDHIGGLASLMETFRPSELWVGANPPIDLVAQAERLGIQVVPQQAAAPFPFSGATVQVLAPTPNYVQRDEPSNSEPRNDEPSNNDSLVLHLRYRARSFLLAGDLERPIENELLATASVPHADVLKVGHHGSRTSSSEPFLDAVSPSIAVISAGFENSYGHPHPDILTRLTARHASVLRTDLTGYAALRTDGARIWYDLAGWHETSQPLALPVHLIQ